MSKKCEDCGYSLREGICTNCHEELYINDYQMSEFPMEVSDAWKDKVSQQRKELRNKSQQPK